jgi:hypothetical protein
MARYGIEPVNGLGGRVAPFVTEEPYRRSFRWEPASAQ